MSWMGAPLRGWDYNCGVRAWSTGAIWNADGGLHGGSVSDYATSMIGLCQEGKSSPDALGRSAGVNSFRFFSACVGLSAVVSISYRTRLPLAVSKISEWSWSED